MMLRFPSIPRTKMAPMMVVTRTRWRRQGHASARVPPENFLISKEGRNIEDARLVGDEKLVTLSDLREEKASAKTR
jgi:hypothetical protein